MVLGVFLYLLAIVAYNSSAILLALAARSRSEQQGPGLAVAVVHRRQGITGMVLSSVGWLLEVAALTRISLTLDEAMTPLGFVLLLFLAAVFLKEPVERREVVGLVTMGTGLALVGLMTPQRSGIPPSVTQWIVIVVLLGPLALIPAARRALGGSPGPIIAAVAAGLSYAMSDMFSAGLGELVQQRRWAALILLAGAGTASFIGFVSELHGLQQGRASAVVPVLVTVQAAVPILFAPFFFSEIWPAEAWQRLITVIGIVLSLAGGIVLARTAEHFKSAGRVKTRAAERDA